MKKIVKDDRIGLCTDKIKYAVLKGGMNITSQSFPTISKNNSSLVFNCPVPSLETIVSREVLWESEFTFRINVENKPVDQFAVNYGVTDALASFPAHSLLSTVSATINNNTVTINMAETLPVLLRLIDPKELSKYESMTPTACDYLSSYKDGIKYCDYQLDSNGGDPDFNDGAVSFPCLFYPYGTGTGIVEPGAAIATGRNSYRARSYISNNNNVLSYDMNRTSGHGYTRGRGSWKIKEFYAEVDGVKVNPRIDSTVIFVTFSVCEPLLLSPFVFGACHGKQGFYGIQSMNFNLTFLSTGANRAWRSSVFNPVAGAPAYTKTVTLASVNDSKLTFTFISPHASDLLAPRNVVPYYDLPFFKTVSNVLIQGKANRGQIVGGLTSAADTKTITSSNIQLSSIPDKIIIFVRKAVQTLRCSDTDSYLTIKNVTIQFNNAVLMSSFTDKQLYRISVDSGLKNMSWDEFSGSVISVAGRVGGGNLSEVRAPFTYVGPNQLGGQNPGFQEIPTTGSIVVIETATHLQLTEDYYAPSSLGSFNLNVKALVENNHNEDWLEYELVVMLMNSGVFVNERGSSSLFTGILTKSDVLASSEQVPYSKQELKRMIGGGFFDTLKSGMKWVSSKLPMVKNMLRAVPNEYAQKAADVLAAVGYGKPKNKLEHRVA